MVTPSAAAAATSASKRSLPPTSSYAKQGTHACKMWRVGGARCRAPLDLGGSAGGRGGPIIMLALPATGMGRGGGTHPERSHDLRSNGPSCPDGGKTGGCAERARGLAEAQTHSCK